MDKNLSTLKSQFKTALDKNKLGHAYLFTGTNTNILIQSALEIICDIETFGNQISSELLLKRLCDGNYSDLMRIDNEDKSVKIDDIRKIASFLQMKTIEGTHRIILINNADMMTIQAQNALLKILEEPYASSLIILLSETIDVFLPTVLSRVQIVQANQTSEQNPPIISLEEQEIIVKHMQNILLLGDICSIFVLSDMFTVKKNRSKTEMYLNYLYSVFFGILRNKKTNEVNNDENNQFHQISTQLSAHFLSQILSTIFTTIKQLKQNASLNIAIQAMFIKIQEDYYAENSRNTI